MAHIIIPARYKSTRFLGKPLVNLAGVPAILRTLRAAQAVPGATTVVVATDSEDIRQVVTAGGGEVVMTPESCRNGTERVAHAASKLGIHPDDIVVNFQGDAPLIPHWFVTKIVAELESSPDASMATPVLKCDLESYERFRNDRQNQRVGATTAVFDATGRAIYFSKELIPYLPNSSHLDTSPVYHHVGLYAFRCASLADYGTWPIGPLEQAEQLEQLRFIEMGRKVVVSIVESFGIEFWELNNPGDVEIIEGMLERNAQRTGLNGSVL